MIILSVGVGVAALVGAVLYFKYKRSKTPKSPSSKVLTDEEAQALFDKYFTLR
jgi:hypothetical protein